MLQVALVEISFKAIAWKCTEGRTGRRCARLLLVALGNRIQHRTNSQGSVSAFPTIRPGIVFWELIVHVTQEINEGNFLVLGARAVSDSHRFSPLCLHMLCIFSSEVFSKLYDYHSYFSPHE